MDEACFIFAMGKGVMFHEQACVCFFAEGLGQDFVGFGGPFYVDVQKIDPPIFFSFHREFYVGVALV